MGRTYALELGPTACEAGSTSCIVRGLPATLTEEVIAVPLANIRGADVELDGVNVTNSKTVMTTNRGSQLAGGLVGGALLGPAGLIVGGLSGGATSKGKSVETRNIKSVKLLVRIADRVKPLHTFVFFDSGYGEGYEADNLMVALEIEKANHFHALLTQVIEDRVANQSGSSF